MTTIRQLKMLGYVAALAVACLSIVGCAGMGGDPNAPPQDVFVRATSLVGDFKREFEAVRDEEIARADQADRAASAAEAAGNLEEAARQRAIAQTSSEFVNDINNNWLRPINALQVGILAANGDPAALREALNVLLTEAIEIDDPTQRVALRIAVAQLIAEIERQRAQPPAPPPAPPS